MRQLSFIKPNLQERNRPCTPTGKFENHLLFNMKFMFLLLFFLLAASFTGVCQYSIPAYNVLISNKATFNEPKHVGVNIVLERRAVIIHVSCGTLSLGKCEATVWVYSLDGKDVLGPYTLLGGDTIYVPIDDREWGVLVNPASAVTVDVWIE